MPAYEKRGECFRKSHKGDSYVGLAGPKTSNFFLIFMESVFFYIVAYGKGKAVSDGDLQPNKVSKGERKC